MKKLLVVLFLVIITESQAQDLSKFRLYNPNENADSAITALVKIAAKEKKHILVQAGGNWCIWCARFNDFTTKDAELDSTIKASYIVYHLNFSKENKNEKVFAKYQYAQRFGFPVFMVLNAKGELIHTQNSAYLEEGKGYSKDKIKEFLAGWSPAALDPAKYKD